MSAPFKAPVDQRPVSKQNVLSLNGGVGNGIYVPSDSALNIRARLYNAIGSTFLNVKGYVLRADNNQVQWFGSQNTLVVENGGNEHVFVISLPEGLLMSVEVSVPQTSAIRGGQLYSTINLQQGVETTPVSPLFATLAAGYVFQGRGLSFPYGDYTNHQDDSQGWATIVLPGAILNPNGAGETIYTVPDYTRFELKSFSMEVLTTGPVDLFIEIFNPSTAVGIIIAVPDFAASNGFVNIGDGYGDRTVAPLFSAVDYRYIGIPTLMLPAGSTIQAIYATADAVTSYGQIALFGRYWIEPLNGAGGGGGQSGGAT